MGGRRTSVALDPQHKRRSLDALAGGFFDPTDVAASLELSLDLKQQSHTAQTHQKKKPLAIVRGKRLLCSRPTEGDPEQNRSCFGTVKSDVKTRPHLKLGRGLAR